ncbi:MAG: hypothetical protein ACEQSA_00665 [Weeksellaceae bacterium]
MTVVLFTVVIFAGWFFTQQTTTQPANSTIALPTANVATPLANGQPELNLPEAHPLPSQDAELYSYQGHSDWLHLYQGYYVVVLTSPNGDEVKIRYLGSVGPAPADCDDVATTRYIITINGDRQFYDICGAEVMGIFIYSNAVFPQGVGWKYRYEVPQ